MSPYFRFPWNHYIFRQSLWPARMSRVRWTTGKNKIQRTDGVELRHVWTNRLLRHNLQLWSRFGKKSSAAESLWNSTFRTKWWAKKLILAILHAKMIHLKPVINLTSTLLPFIYSLMLRSISWMQMLCFLLPPSYKLYGVMGGTNEKLYPSILHNDFPGQLRMVIL